MLGSSGFCRALIFEKLKRQPTSVLRIPVCGRLEDAEFKSGKDLSSEGKREMHYPKNGLFNFDGRDRLRVCLARVVSQVHLSPAAHLPKELH